MVQTEASCVEPLTRFRRACAQESGSRRSVHHLVVGCEGQTQGRSDGVCTVCLYLGFGQNSPDPKDADLGGVYDRCEVVHPQGAKI